MVLDLGKKGRISQSFLKYNSFFNITLNRVCMLKANSEVEMKLKYLDSSSIIIF